MSDKKAKIIYTDTDEAPALATITSGELMPPPPPDADDDADARPLEDHLRECVAILKRRKGREEPVALLLRDFCAAHPDQRHKVVKAGLIGPLIGLVRSSRTGSCKGAAASALAQLAFNDEGNRRAILACEGEKPLGALVVDRNAPPTARAAACDALANLGAGAADGVVAARLHVAAFTALATDDESSLEVKASAARALANALRPLEDVEDEAVNPSLSACALELLASDDHREAGASLARALVLATELDESTVKKLSAALVAAIDSDGKVRYVIAHQDPGIQNWLDTTGHYTGMLSQRWAYTDAPNELPTLEVTKVNFSDIDQHLPKDTSRITASERKEIIPG